MSSSEEPRYEVAVVVVDKTTDTIAYIIPALTTPMAELAVARLVAILMAGRR